MPERTVPAPLLIMAARPEKEQNKEQQIHCEAVDTSSARSKISAVHKVLSLDRALCFTQHCSTLRCVFDWRRHLLLLCSLLRGSQQFGRKYVKTKTVSDRRLHVPSRGILLFGTYLPENAFRLFPNAGACVRFVSLVRGLCTSTK